MKEVTIRRDTLFIIDISRTATNNEGIEEIIPYLRYHPSRTLHLRHLLLVQERYFINHITEKTYVIYNGNKYILNNIKDGMLRTRKRDILCSHEVIFSEPVRFKKAVVMVDKRHPDTF